MRTRSARAFAAGLLLAGILLALSPPLARADDPPPPLRIDDVRFVATGERACGVRVGDFDEDGWPDLVHRTTNEQEDALFLHRNDQAGGFAERIRLPLEAWPCGLEVADLDEDGHLDLAVSMDVSPAAVTILRGDGSAGFAAHTVATPYLFEIRAIADVNADGHLDLVGVMTLRIAVLLGDGTGAFPTLRVSSPDSPPDRIALVDLDEDGFLDAVFTGSFEGYLGVMSGLGNGRFGDFRFASTLSRPIDLATGDFNSDGHADVAVARTASPTVLVLRGDGAGGFAAPQNLSGPTNLEAILSSDWNRDGYADLAVVSNAGLVVWLGSHNGVFTPIRNLPLAWGPVEMAVADLDRDGDRDTIVALSSRKRMIVLPGRGSDAMLELPLPLIVDDSVGGGVTADFDEDGHTDVALGSDQGVHLLLGGGRGDFEYRMTPIVTNEVRFLEAAEMNGDGHADIVTASFYGPYANLEVWTGNGQGGFDRTDSDYAGEVVAFGVFDFDHDGDLDVADLVQFSFRVRFNDGSGMLAPPIEVALSAVGRDFMVGDFNGDGFGDVAVSLVPDGSVGRIRFYFGDGTGAFPATAEIVNDAAAAAAWLRPFDLDADGDLDFVCAAGASGGWHLYSFLGDGAGGFAYHGEYGVGTHFFGPSIAGDFDDDGHLDLAHVSASWVEGVAVVRGDGAGGFLDHVPVLLARAEPPVLVAGDFDEDGHLDLLIPSPLPMFTDTQISFHRNRTYDGIECRRGEVNAGAGPRADVLLVDGSPGEGPQRRLVYALGQSFEVRMELPPGAGGQARFALYAWDRAPYVGSVELEPYRLGRACLPMPLGPSFLAPSVIWNNTGKARLGIATKQSSPAPTIVGVKAAGHGLVGSFFLQGIIEDPLAPSGKAAVTNGIELVFE